MTQSILDSNPDKNIEGLVKHLKKPSYAVKTDVHIAYIQKNFGKLSFDEISNHLNISNKTLKKIIRTIFPLDSRPFLFQRLLKQALDNFSLKWLNEDSLSQMKNRAIELGEIYTASQKFKHLRLENYSVLCIVVIAEAYSQITKKDKLYFVRSKLRKNVKFRRYSLRRLLRKDMGKEKSITERVAEILN